MILVKASIDKAEHFLSIDPAKRKENAFVNHQQF